MVRMPMEHDMPYFCSSYLRLLPSFFRCFGLG